MKADLQMFSRVALRNISRHWKRSLAAILSLASGFAAINLFEGYIADVEHVFSETYSKRLMYGDILIQRKETLTDGLEEGERLIRQEDQHQLEEILEKSKMVNNSVRFLNITGLVSNGSATSVFRGLGYDVDAGLKMREPNWSWNALAGIPLDQGVRNPQNILIGQGLGRILDCSPTSRPKEMTFLNGYSRESRPIVCKTSELELNVTSGTGQMNATNVHVHGMIDAVYREFDARYIAMSLEKAQALLNTSGVSLYSVRLKDSSDAKKFISYLSEEFTRKNLSLKAFKWQNHSFGGLYVQSIDFLNVFRDFTLIVVLIIISLSVLSQLMRLVQERTREIGTLRCLGYMPHQIRSLFLIEAFFLSIFGSALGALLTVVLAPAMNSLGILYKVGILSEKIPFRISIVGVNFGMSAFVLTAIAMGAATIAILRALRKSIPDALMH
ncbi:MAG: hypothetical protein JWQ35_2361 [Bacteriovoracaceae bacterium]|nr:hypothetical protein [Bacteriovoracaceae bacterium]